MAEIHSGKTEKFTAVELRPKRSVRIHRTPNRGRDYFTVSYYDEAGRRQRKVYPDADAARAEAPEIRKRMDKGLLPGLLLSGGDRLIYELALEAARSVKIDLDLWSKMP